MTFSGPIADRLAIRELFDSYGDAVFRRDAEAWSANWCEDSVWSLPSFEIAGRAQIKAAWVQAMDAFVLTAFFHTPGSIVVTGDAATARSYTQEVLTDAQGAVRRIVGTYEDELARDGGVWRFRKRAYRFLHDQTDG